MKLAGVRKLALSLPEVTEEPHFHMTSFRVRSKIFVTAPPEGTHLHVFVQDMLREAALAAHPDFIEKLLWGKRVAGLRVALATARQDVVENLVRAAWEGKAGKSALAKILWLKARDFHSIGFECAAASSEGEGDAR